MSEDDTQVLRRFFAADGRLMDMPVKRSKRLLVLDHVAQRFEPGRRYDWREVDEVLKAVHDDHAALRRYLVEEAFLSRSDDVYWRSGGTVEV
ncbi:hypothetical protein GCM10028801_13150 [Nocardioides maradonensis]